MNRSQVDAGILLTAIAAGTHQVTGAAMHPDDTARYDITTLMRVLKLSRMPTITSNVERGMLYVDTKANRR